MEASGQSSGEKDRNLEFKFSTLRKVDAKEANIFVHGYSAGHDIDDRQELIKSIPLELHDQLNVFAFWPSSHFSRLSGKAKSLIFAVSRINVVASALVLAADRIAHFALIRSRADDMGAVLYDQIRDYLKSHHPQVERVNLIGHSLGGRVIVSLLKRLPFNKSEQYPAVGNVLLMAAAAEISSREAFSMFQRINGRLVNAYSESDSVLVFNADEDSLGRRKVRYFSNIHMKGFGHSDYWPNLREVMRRSRISSWGGPGTSLSLLPENDLVKGDSHLYQVLRVSDPELLDAATKHLKSSSWTTISDSEADPALALTRELQLVAGHFLANFSRGRGVVYSTVLKMLAEHYGLSSELHRCAKIVEYEQVLIQYIFQHAFPDGHPLVNATFEDVKMMSKSVYLVAVDSLAKRLTLASYFQKKGEIGPSLKADFSTGIVDFNADSDVEKSYLKSTLELFRGMEKEAGRVLTNLKTAIKPGYSALIPTIAIVYYSRLQIDEECFM